MFDNNSNTCRICLQSSSRLDIFETMANEDVVANLLIDLAGIEISFDYLNPMPRCICDVCCSNLITAYEMRKQIRDSDSLLREMYDIQNVDDNGAKFQLKIVEAVSFVESIDLLVEKPETIKTEMIDVETDDWVMPSQKIPEVVVEPVLPTKTDYNCCMCPEHFDDFELLKQHALDKHNKQWQPTNIPKRRGHLKEGAQCDLCGRKYSTSARLRQHKIHYKVMVACDVCGSMVARQDVAQHKWTHNEDEVECEFCHKKYKKIYIKEHMKNVHLDKKFKCDLCLKEFAIKSHMKRHIDRVHNSSYKKSIRVTCPICNRGFECLSLMRKHMLMHSGQKRYSCEHCPATFVYNTDHRRHVWTHTGSPHSCTKCNKYMDRPSQLKAHQAAGCENQVRKAQRRMTNPVTISESGTNNDESHNAL